MKFASLFDGIGGFPLGFSAHGAELAWLAEIAEFPASVSHARFGDVPNLGDVREIDASGDFTVDGVCGGFPCQDLSLAGRGAGLAGARSGLWGEMFRVIDQVDPAVVFIENVPALLTRGMEKVLYDLTSIGFGVEWDCLPAASFGAPHLRDRVWIVAHRLGKPSIFGRPAALFKRVVVDKGEKGWRRWPRAGYATDADSVLELQPLAPIGRAKKGVRVPTITAAVYGSSQNGVNSSRPSAGTPSLHTMARRDLFPTVVASDAFGSRRATARAPWWKSKPGVTLLDRVSEEEGIEWETAEAPREIASGERMFPTPLARPTGRTPEQHAEARAKIGRGVSDLEAEVVLREREREGAEPRIPTPMAADGERTSEAYPRGNDTLLGHARAAAPARWPSPQASDADRGADFARQGREGSGGDDLVTAIARSGAGERLLPTPRATDGDARNRGDLIAHAKDRPNSHHPGPREEGRGEEQRAGALNPTWVEWLMGFPLGWTDPRVSNDDLGWQDWSAEPEGVPRITAERELRRDRLTALGNALVPVIPAWLLGRYLTAQARSSGAAATLQA